MSESLSPTQKGHRPARERSQSKSPELEIVLTDDGSHTLARRNSHVSWHSESGALSESRLVFFENSGVQQSLSAGNDVRICEIGFGTGLNFWITASHALSCTGRLEFVSFEPHLLDTSVIHQLQYQRWPECSPAIEQFLPVLDQQNNIHSADLERTVANVQLRIRQQDSNSPSAWDGLSQLDAVFHDPFAPADAPELWAESLFQREFDILKPGGRLVTYCVKSEIQKRLKSVGFEIQKTRGPVGGKREVLLATKPQS